MYVGGGTDGRSGADPYEDGRNTAGDPASGGRVFLGEHWGGLGEHWGPARTRYLQGPWYPHQEEIDRCVPPLCLLFLFPC